MLAAKTILIPLDLTHLVLADNKVQRMIYDSARAKPPAKSSELAENLRPMFHDLLMFFAGTYRNVFGLTSGPPLHDPIAVAAILPESLISFDDRDGERWHVEIVTDGSHGKDNTMVRQLGRTVIAKAGRNGVRIPRGVDTKCFWELIDQALSDVEQSLMGNNFC